MKNRRLIAIALALCISLSMLVVTSSAADMTSSDPLVEFIKSCEGFSKYAYWDYSHYTIGYGTQCGKNDYPNGITEAEAETLLRKHLRSTESAVNDFVNRNSMNPTQNQFDCMMSMTYALGTEWMRSSYSLPKLLINGCTELELLNTLGSWVTAGGETLPGLIYRRMRETNMYFHGEYNSSGNVANDVPYACLRFDPAGGSVSEKRLYTFRGQPYNMYIDLPVPTRDGYVFRGWFDSDGKQFTNSTIAESVLTTVTARWEEGNPNDWVFSDVNSSDWFFEDVKKSEELGIFEGYPDGSFRPNVDITRAMFVQILHRAAGEVKSDAAEPFVDVRADHWYYDAVCWAYNNGVVKGISEDQFAPEQEITREQMATMLYNYCVSIGQARQEEMASLESFVDEDMVSDFAVDAMSWAVGVGLIQGIGNDQLAPKVVATRAQAAAIMVRLTALLEKNIA